MMMTAKNPTRTLIAFFILSLPQYCGAQDNAWRFSDLSSCPNVTGTSAPEGFDDPCIRHLIEPTSNTSATGNSTINTTVVNLLHITDWECEQHRDGPHTAVRLLNQVQPHTNDDESNFNNGIPIGFHRNTYVQFRLVSVIAGDYVKMGPDAYNQRHQALLRNLIEDLDVHFIIGTCSKLAHNEPEIANNTSTMLLAQVGPPSFYRNSINPWLFGLHVSSDEYTVDATRRLQFWVDEEQRSPATQPVRIMYRSKSEFFFSTCQAAVQNLKEAGFTDLLDFVYDAGADDDEDGIPNSQDEDFLRPIADHACPPGSALNKNYSHGFHPAFFFCTVTEQEIFLQRFQENGCRPSAIWLTATTWPWAPKNLDTVPYFQGGGQWHPALGYSDRYFSSGVDLLEQTYQTFGYRGGYDLVVSYSIPVILAGFLETIYRVQDEPDFSTDMRDPVKREQLRREMVNLKADSLFGPVVFNKNQRNAGREAAASQWQPMIGGAAGASNDTEANNLELVLVSPISHAQASAVVPAASTSDCGPGTFVNIIRIVNESSILGPKCSPCPVDTFSAVSSNALACEVCPVGSTTNGETGVSACTLYEDNLISPGLIGFGAACAAVCWVLALIFLVWCFWNRKDPVVSMAQLEYLVLICIGAIISSSSLVGLSFQAAHDEDTTQATRACQSIPFLYTIGWVLQYASLSAKTYRLSKIVNTSSHTRAKADRWTGLWIVLGSLLIDMIIIIVWTVVAPLEYIRETSSVALEDQITVVESSGQCRMSTDDISIWVFVGPLFANHLALMVGTHVLLDRVRTVNHRYQEKRYIGMASILVLQVALIGIPVLVAAGDSVESTFVILTSIVTLDSLGVLCLIFGPKIFYQRKGLEAGIGVGESILTESHENAKVRERNRSSYLSGSSFFQEPSLQLPPNSSNQPVSSLAKSSLTNSSVPMSSSNSQAAVTFPSSQYEDSTPCPEAPRENDSETDRS